MSTEIPASTNEQPADAPERLTKRDIRERFEAWAVASPRYWSVARLKRRGRYRGSCVNAAWLAWQAASEREIHCAANKRVRGWMGSTVDGGFDDHDRYEQSPELQERLTKRDFVADLTGERVALREQLTRLVEALHFGRTDTQRLINEWRCAELLLRKIEDGATTTAG